MDSSDAPIPKRVRTDQHDGARAQIPLNHDGGHAGIASEGRAQLLLTSPDLVTRLGKKYCDEAELLPLLLALGIVRRVHTIEVEIRPLGGDSFKVALNAAKPTVSEVKAEIARLQGTAAELQVLFKVAMRADGSAVREDDAEPEPLEDEDTKLKNGEMVAMAVKEPLIWRSWPAHDVVLEENGAVATQLTAGAESLIRSGLELTEDKHYWEVELLLIILGPIYVGVCRPDLDPSIDYLGREKYGGWFINTNTGALYGSGKERDAAAGAFKQGDRVGVLLDLDNGSLQFFKNGVPHGPGYAAGSVTGPVVHALRLFWVGQSARLLPDAKPPRK
jgi:hypothetical protein